MSEPEIQTGPGAEVTVDGLHRIDNSVFQRAWLKPSADFTTYTQVMLDPVGIAYKRKPKSTRYNRTRSKFALTDRQMAEM